MQARFITYKYGQLVFIFLFWNAVAILTATMLFVQFADAYPDATWSGFFFRQAPLWYTWMLFTPFILYLTPFTKKRKLLWWQTLVFHLLIATFMIVLYSLIAGRHSIYLSDRMTYSTKILLKMASRNFALNFASNCLIYLLIAFVGVGLEWYKALAITKEEKLKLQLHNNVLHTQLVEAQLQALTMQLQPHFLFNTLHSIASLVRIRQNETAIRMIADFSELLRHTIQHGEDNFATIKTEIAFVEKYLNIEKIRFQEHLSVHIQVEDAAQEVLVPSLILQPFVENAIKHGISQTTQKGKINITVTRENGRVNLYVQDNGAGLPTHWSIHQGQGVGISNSFRRLEKIYGQNFILALHNLPEGGTNTHIQIPSSSPIKNTAKHVAH